MRRSLPAVTPNSALLAPGVLVPQLPRQHSRRRTRDHYLSRIRLLACDQRKINWAARLRAWLGSSDLCRNHPRNPPAHCRSLPAVAHLLFPCFPQGYGFPAPLLGQRAQAVRSRAHGPRTRVTRGKGRKAPRCDSHARRFHYFSFTGTESKLPNFSSNGSTSS